MLPAPAAYSAADTTGLSTALARRPRRPGAGDALIYSSGLCFADSRFPYWNTST